MEVIPVQGTVKCAGRLLTEGYVLFTPVPDMAADRKKSGKSATGYIQSDGTYVLTTYDEGDGAIPGRHKVRVYKPDPEDDEQEVGNLFACGQQVLEVTVEPETDNVIDLDPAARIPAD